MFCLPNLFECFDNFRMAADEPRSFTLTTATSGQETHTLSSWPIVIPESTDIISLNSSVQTFKPIKGETPCFFHISLRKYISQDNEAFLSEVLSPRINITRIKCLRMSILIRISILDILHLFALFYHLFFKIILRYYQSNLYQF